MKAMWPYSIFIVLAEVLRQYVFADGEVINLPVAVSDAIGVAILFYIVNVVINYEMRMRSRKR